MEVMGVFSSWVTALMKPSCCSLRRISRTRKMVLRIIPAMIAAKKITPKNSSTPWRQFRMVQPTVRAMARATRAQPSTTKKSDGAIWHGRTTASRGLRVAKLRRPEPMRERARSWREHDPSATGLHLGRSQRAGIFPRERLGHHGLISALNFGNFRGVDFLGDADLFQRPDHVPVEINLVPGQAVPRGDGMRMMIVVPAFAPRYQRHPPAIGG